MLILYSYIKVRAELLTYEIELKKMEVSLIKVGQVSIRYHKKSKSQYNINVVPVVFEMHSNQVKLLRFSDFNQPSLSEP